VLPLSGIIAANVVIRSFHAMIHAFPLLGALHGAAALLYGFSFAERDYASIQYNSLTTYFTLLLVFFWIHLLRIVM
jgi:hypothetical protein